MEKDKKTAQPDTIVRNFGLTNFALANKNTIFLVTIVAVLFGMLSYRSLPKELMPDIVIPTVMVQSVYPGNPPIDIENLITRPLEKEIEPIKGIKEVRSTSNQDYSMIFVEFNPNVDIKEALNDVKDAVDKAKSELPTDMTIDPTVMDIDFSEFPIININLFGDYSLDELKSYAEYLQDEIELVPEISKVEITGITEKEVRIDVDPVKMELMDIGFNDIQGAIMNENVSMSGGEMRIEKTRRSVRIIGEFENIRDIKNIIVKHEDMRVVYLKEIADVSFSYEDAKSYARLNGQPVVSMKVVKKSGENLLSATDQIYDILAKAKKDNLVPENLNISTTNDQSDSIRKQLNNLENSMVLGVIFVVGVLFFFLGARNALFVGLAIPMSMFLSFMVLGLLGAKINMIVLFSLILALGMLVDNAIVVVENIYRFVDKGYSVADAARQATGEIAIAIISSTATTLAAFLPLAFWNSIIGEFMKYLPITLIIVLTSSLFVALVIIPVFAKTFVKKQDGTHKLKKRRAYMIMIVTAGLAIIGHLAGANGFGNLMAFAAIMTAMNLLFLNRASNWFQAVFLTRLENGYRRVITASVKGRRSLYVFLGTIGLFILTMMFFSARQPQVLFFPSTNPTYINILAEMPLGTDLSATDSVMRIVEADLKRIIAPHNPSVNIKSVLTTVGTGAKGESDQDVGETPFKGLITLTFQDYEKLVDLNSGEVMKEVSDALIGKYPGVRLSVEKNRMGPPTGKAVSLEIIGKKFEKLVALADTISGVIMASQIDGIEGLKLDLDVGRPELLIHIDRDKAQTLGLSTIQIAGSIRTALFGREAGDYKIGEDDYPIQIRMSEEARNDLPSLMNQKIVFRNNKGKLMKIPISSVADIQYSSTYGAVKRKDLNRVVTLGSNVMEGYNPTAINDKLKALMNNFKMPDGYTFKFTGEQEKQQESMGFLVNALMIALALIIIIMVTQFNSIIKPLIIMASVLFSTIGVFGGLAVFRMDFIIVMTGVGIISLAGVVVNNAIVLIDYIDLTKNRKKKELGLDKSESLPTDIAQECVIIGGRTRLRPVLLTAITTILGLLPMALGMNINFKTLLTDLDPQLYFGGQMAGFWGSMSWTVIFGLTFSTFLTLIVVPSMYHLFAMGKLKIRSWTERLT
ncbi:MAG: efflux RND transporter permease subunit [Bacteroidetes bacterium]|nr:efflux RND transporter permease subunit [Bacteroidota bacterium]MBU1719334.1 efflux RND transporter permease subunit [Bacteroidota bacterium]